MFNKYFVVASLVVAFFVIARGQENKGKNIDWSTAEKNYIAALRIDNAGVKTSAAFYIRKYELTGALEELKELLDTQSSDNVKMSAALALVSIGGIEGHNAVEEAMQKEESELVVEFYRSILNSQGNVRQQ